MIYYSLTNVPFRVMDLEFRLKRNTCLCDLLKFSEIYNDLHMRFHKNIGFKIFQLKRNQTQIVVNNVPFCFF